MPRLIVWSFIVQITAILLYSFAQFSISIRYHLILFETIYDGNELIKPDYIVIVRDTSSGTRI